MLLVLAALILLVWPTEPLHSDNFIFYIANRPQSLPLKTIGEADYLPLFPMLNLVGTVRGIKGSGDSVNVYFGDTELRFRADNATVEVGKSKVKLDNPTRFVEGQWLVPIEILSRVLPRIVVQPIQYQRGARRIFIGGAKPATYAVKLVPTPTGSRVVVDFSDAVGVKTASKDGRWIFYLSGRPVEPLESHIEFQNNPYVSSLDFDDQDGVPKLILVPATQGLDLYPTLEQGNKVLSAEVAKPAPAGTAPSQATSGETTAPAPTPSGQAPAGAPPVAAPGLPEASGTPGMPIVVLDPGHGGDDPGAHGANGVLEKNLVAQFAAQVRSALLASGRYRVLLTRSGDTAVDFDQRATIANAAHPEAFLTLHAGALGSVVPRVVVYSFQPPLPVMQIEGAAVRPLWIPWDRTQEYYLPRSRSLAQAIQQQLARVQGVTADKPDMAPARTLRNINAPAVAVEIGSLESNLDAGPLLDADFQRQLAEAIVRGLDTFSSQAGQP